MKYKNILVAVDGSEISKQALHEAIDLAKDQKAKLRIIHVVDDAGSKAKRNTCLNSGQMM